MGRDEFLRILRKTAVEAVAVTLVYPALPAFNHDIQLDCYH